MADLYAHQDVITFLAIGDMVLDNLATEILAERRLPRGRVPWASLMYALDCPPPRGFEPDPIKAPARRLDLLLREARHRLVAHRVRGYLILSWEHDGSLSGVEARNSGTAARLGRSRGRGSALPSGHARAAADPHPRLRGGGSLTSEGASRPAE